MAKSFGWCFKAYRFSRSFIEPSRDGIEMVLVDIGQVHACREVLSQQSIDLQKLIEDDGYVKYMNAKAHEEWLNTFRAAQNGNPYVAILAEQPDLE